MKIVYKYQLIGNKSFVEVDRHSSYLHLVKLHHIAYYFRGYELANVFFAVHSIANVGAADVDERCLK